MAPTVRDAAVFRADTGSGGAGRGRAGRDALKRRPAVFLRHARGALFPFRDRVARPTSEFARSGCAPPRRSAPSSTTRPPRTPTPPSADQPRPWMRVGAPATCAIRRKALPPRKSAGDFSARKIAGKNARAPTCVFCSSMCCDLAGSAVSLVRLFASSCSKNRQRGPTFDLAPPFVLRSFRVTALERRGGSTSSPASATDTNTLSLIVNMYEAAAFAHTSRVGPIWPVSSWCARREMARAARTPAQRRAETLLVFLFASKACEKGSVTSSGSRKEKDRGTGPYLYCRRTRP